MHCVCVCVCVFEMNVKLVVYALTTALWRALAPKRGHCAFITPECWASHLYLVVIMTSRFYVALLFKLHRRTAQRNIQPYWNVCQVVRLPNICRDLQFGTWINIQMLFRSPPPIEMPQIKPPIASSLLLTNHSITQCQSLSKTCST